MMAGNVALMTMIGCGLAVVNYCEAFGLFFPNYTPVPSPSQHQKYHNFLRSSTDVPASKISPTSYEGLPEANPDVETFDVTKGKFGFPWLSPPQEISRKENYKATQHGKKRGSTYDYDGSDYPDYDSHGNGCDHDFNGDDEFYPYYRRHHHNFHPDGFFFGNNNGPHGRPTTKAPIRPTTRAPSSRPSSSTTSTTTRRTVTTPRTVRTTIPQIDIRIGNFKKRDVDPLSYPLSKNQ